VERDRKIKLEMLKMNKISMFLFSVMVRLRLLKLVLRSKESSFPMMILLINSSKNKLLALSKVLEMLMISIYLSRLLMDHLRRMPIFFRFPTNVLD
jgi:hypothetical protein